MKKCGLPWLPIDGEPRYDKCETEADTWIRIPGERKRQRVCGRHAGQMIGLMILSGDLAKARAPVLGFLTNDNPQ